MAKNSKNEKFYFVIWLPLWTSVSLCADNTKLAKHDLRPNYYAIFLLLCVKSSSNRYANSMATKKPTIST